MRRVNIGVDFLGFKLRSPLIAASGPPTKDLDAIRRLAVAGVGAAITKTILLDPSINPRPCMFRDERFFLNTERCSTLSLPTWIDEQLPGLAELPIPIIASIGMTPDDAEALAGPVVSAGADMLELSIFTPYDDPSPMIEAIQRVKSRVSVPILVKLSCNVHDPVEFARKLKEAGADAISAIDAIKAGMVLNPQTGRPAMLEQGFGRVSGEAIKPIALYHVAQLAHYVDLPIVGTGGVTTATDALEMLYCGAQTVGLCTSLIVEGPAHVRKINDELEKLLLQVGASSVPDVRGRTLSFIDFTKDTDERREYEKRVWERITRTAKINPEVCKRCDRCFQVCPYHAIERPGEAYNVVPARCQGCGLCVSICPVSAIAFVEKEAE